MSLANPYRNYQESAITTQTPAQLVIMTYDGAIKNMNFAILHIKSKDYEKAHKAIVKAEALFGSLAESLDLNQPISRELLDFYKYFISTLMNANLKKDAALISDILPLVTELRDTWKEAEKQLRMRHVSPAASGIQMTGTSI